MITVLFVLFAAAIAPIAPEEDLLFGFDKATEADAWQAVNDNVMGGVSDGRLGVTDDGILEFYGRVSLENNGGFASLRSIPREQDLSNFDGILIRIKGDGNRYDFNIRTDFAIMAGSYRQKFETRTDVWQQVFLPFDSFKATSFGQLLSNAPRLNTREVRSLGLTISDKQEGPFQLQIDWIKATKAPTKFEERIVKVSCASCVFQMKNVTGCKLAVEIDSMHYLVEGSSIDDHGDAHAPDGLCNAVRWAKMSGKTIDKRFFAGDMRMLP